MRPEKLWIRTRRPALGQVETQPKTGRWRHSPLKPGCALQWKRAITYQVTQRLHDGQRSQTLPLYGFFRSVDCYLVIQCILVLSPLLCMPRNQTFSSPSSLLHKHMTFRFSCTISHTACDTQKSCNVFVVWLKVMILCSINWIHETRMILSSWRNATFSLILQNKWLFLLMDPDARVRCFIITSFFSHRVHPDDVKQRPSNLL